MRPVDDRIDDSGFEEIRDGIRRVCSKFDDVYWRERCSVGSRRAAVAAGEINCSRHSHSFCNLRAELRGSCGKRIIFPEEGLRWAR